GLLQNILRDPPANQTVSGLGKQAGRQVVQRGEVVKQYTAGTVRPFGLNPDLRADLLCHLFMCLCLPVQPQHPTQPVPAAQKALPESGSSRVVLVPEVGDLSAVNLAGQRRHSRKSETLQPQHLLVFPAALCMLRSAVPGLPAQNCIELLPVLLRVKPIAGPAVPDD
ncbi:CarD-like/TRCF domain, partial [Dysosmobacter welbionis]